MNRIIPHIAKFGSLFFLLVAFPIAGPGVTAQEVQMNDSIDVAELLVIDTINLEILGPSNDVAFYMNGLVFLSNTKYHHGMLPEHINFGQNASYFVPLDYIAVESCKLLFPNDPFPYSPAGTCYTRDYKTVYFTKIEEISGRRRPEKIFEMQIINGQGSEYNQLSFTAGPTRYMHPAISVDGEFMILASDLVPTNGGLDLFIVRKTTGGWTNPVNLGSDINTSGHEWYPFLDQHNNLFFSSSGHMGYGGYDIYVCFFNGNGWDKPKNLTNLINSGKDEIGFSIHPSRKMAVFSTKTEEEGQKEEVLMLGLNNQAFILAGIDTRNQDLSLLLRDMIRTGYTSAKFGAATKLEVEAGASLTSLPLITEQVEESEPEPAVAAEVPVAAPLVQEPEPEPVLQVKEPEPERVVVAPVVVAVTRESEPEPEPAPAPDRVLFRVQILSSTNANSRPKVTIAGSTYTTWEYYYKGAYRITVGEFASVQEALTFRSKCRDSGFGQAFVAAFRGNERETDPSVFK
jgi:hypothetical protein